MRYIIFTLSLIFIIGCNTNKKELSEIEIDQIVNSISDPEKLYDIALSMRFTRDGEQYEASEFSTNDTIVLYIENYESEEKMFNRQIFFYQNQPIFINEIGYKPVDGQEIQYQQKIYLNNNEITSAYEAIIEDENLESLKFKPIELNISKFDFNKPKNAVHQKGDFEMKFGEFLIIEPESYLILDNKKSKYTVALYIIDGDETLNTLFEKQNQSKGKTVFVYHEFVTMNGINRMLYKGSYFVED